MAKKLAFIVLLAACIFVTLEGMSLVALWFLTSKGIVYALPRVTQKALEEYQSNKNPITGWPSAKDLSGASRDCPYFPNASVTPPCISTYGESFTLSADIPSEKAWTNLLAKKLGCRVSNYSVGGFGTDQAYLRFLNNPVDPAPVVILGVVTENILRNVNQYRYFLYPGGVPLTFKPRFILDTAGMLQMVPMPMVAYDKFNQFARSPEKFLSCECYIPGTKWGLTLHKFPFTITLFKAFFTQFHMKAALRGMPWHAEFYDPRHPCQGLQVTVGIIRQFCADAEIRGKSAIILIMPTFRDLEYYRNKGVWVYAPLLKELDAAHVYYIDAGPKLYASLRGKNPAMIYDRWRAHYNIEGDARLAQIIYEALQDAPRTH